MGATLGNDVNLRDVEGRSALLLSKAKDNNASAAIGPLVRFFDGAFNLDAVRRTEVGLTVEGEDGFTLEGRSSMAEIARDPADPARMWAYLATGGLWESRDGGRYALNAYSELKYIGWTA